MARGRSTKIISMIQWIRTSRLSKNHSLSLGSGVETHRLLLKVAVRIDVEPALIVHLAVGGGVRIHPENARMSGRHGVQYVAQCVECAALTLVVRQ